MTDAKTSAGLEGVVAAETVLSQVDGERGILRVRGHELAELVADQVREVIGADGVDRIIDVDFGANIQTSLKVLRPGGAIVSYASMAAPEPQIPFYGLMGKNALMRLVLV